MTSTDFYNAAVSVYFSYKTNKKRSKDETYKHDEFTRKRNMSGCSQLFSWSKSTLIVACILVNYKRNPKSIQSMFRYLSELEPAEITSFKDLIKNYKLYFLEELKYIKDNRINEIEDLFNLYVQRKIKFFTLYYFVMKYNLEEEVYKSRIFSTLYNTIKTTMSYLNLKEVSERLS